MLVYNCHSNVLTNFVIRASDVQAVLASNPEALSIE